MTNHLTSRSTAGVEKFLELYRVEPGVPLDLAFDELSVLIGCIKHLNEEAEMEVFWTPVADLLEAVTSND